MEEVQTKFGEGLKSAMQHEDLQGKVGEAIKEKIVEE